MTDEKGAFPKPLFLFHGTCWSYRLMHIPFSFIHYHASVLIRDLDVCITHKDTKIFKFKYLGVMHDALWMHSYIISLKSWDYLPLTNDFSDNPR